MRRPELAVDGGFNGGSMGLERYVDEWVELQLISRAVAVGWSAPRHL